MVSTSQEAVTIITITSRLWLRSRLTHSRPEPSGREMSTISKRGSLPAIRRSASARVPARPIRENPAVEETSSPNMAPIRSSSSIISVKIGFMTYTNWFLFK